MLYFNQGMNSQRDDLISRLAFQSSKFKENVRYK